MSSSQTSDTGEGGSAAPAQEPEWRHSESDPDKEEELLEPQLKYERLGSDVQDILDRSQATCLCLSDKLVALGTSRGTLHILDYSGNEVKRLEGHHSPISALCFDAESEFLASAAQTASVRIQNLYSEEVQRLEFRSGIKALALDPRFGSRKTKEVVTGTTAGVLQLSAHGWLGRNDTTLHSGEGPIYEAQWIANLIIWSNDLGARVYDYATHRHVGLIERPKGGAFAPAFRCSIFVVDETTLYLGWPDYIKVVKVTDAPVPEQLNGNKKTLVPLLELPTTSFVRGVAPFGDELAVLVHREGDPDSAPLGAAASIHRNNSMNSMPNTPSSVSLSVTGLPVMSFTSSRASTVDVLPVVAGSGMLTRGDGSVGSVDVNGNGVVSREDTRRSADFVGGGERGDGNGAGPVGESVHEGGEQDGVLSPSARSVSDFGDRTAVQVALCPELRIIAKDKTERAVDVLPVNAYQDNEPQDYFLIPSASLRRSARVPARPGSSSHLEDAMYFIVSPKDIVVGKPRGAEDRVIWLMQHHRYEAALAIAQVNRMSSPSMFEQVANNYLNYLLTVGESHKAASLCPRLLGKGSKWWERWVYLFAQKRHLAELADFVPTKPPCQLRSTAYEMILNSFLLNPTDHPKLLQLVKTWPRGIYNSATLVDAVSMRMQRPGGASHALWEVLAHLYLQQSRPDLSLAIYLQMHNPVVFDFTREHHLVHTINGAKVAMLMEINEEEAMSFLVQEIEVIPPSAVVPALIDMMNQQAADSKEFRLWRKRLHVYLHKVFVVDHTLAAEYHELQVALYADFDVGKLMQFLVASQYYPLEAALETCQERGLVPEMVFVLGRMGNTRQALYLIIERMADIPRAIEFVKEQQDEELWEDLISWALSSPETTGALLDHCGGNINPLQLISRIPEGMHIPRLRDRIRSIIADFRTQTTLREGCNVILHSDCLSLVSRLFVEIRRAIRVVYIPPSSTPSDRLTLVTSPVNSPTAATVVPAAVIPLTGANGNAKSTGLDMTPLPVFSLNSSAGAGQWQRYEVESGSVSCVTWENVPSAVRNAVGGGAGSEYGSPMKRGWGGRESSVQLLVEPKEMTTGAEALRMKTDGQRLRRGQSRNKGAVPHKEALPSLVQ